MERGGALVLLLAGLPLGGLEDAVEPGWMGHMAAHFWAASAGAVIAVGAARVRRAPQPPTGAFGKTVTVTMAVALIAAIATASDAAGAHPALEVLHDASTAIAAPSLGLLLLLLLILVGFALRDRTQA